MVVSTSRQVSAADRAHAAIRSSIRSGERAPGSMLSENDLAAALSMSRTPVRAALARLQEEGWVTIYPQRGALVRALSQEEVREAAEVRHSLETAGVRLALPADRGQLEERLDASLQAQADALRAGDMAAFTELAAGFHREFVVLARNATMLDFYDRLQDRQVLSIVGSAHRITASPDRIIEEHRLLLQHAREGAWAEFGATLAEHQRRSHDLEHPQVRPD